MIHQARVEEKVVGFVVCQLNNKTGRVYMRWVTLAPNFHGCGIGRAMLEAVEKRFPEAIGIELFTRTENHAAREFYAKLGFKETPQIQSKPKLDTEISLYQDDCVYPVTDDEPDPSHLDAYVGCIKKNRMII